MVGLFSERIVAVRTTAEVGFVSSNLFLHGQMPRFLRQAGGAHNKIFDLLQVFFWISNKYIDASLAAEMVFLTVKAMSCSLILADP